MLAMAHIRQGIGRIDETELVSAAYLARLSVARLDDTEEAEGPMKSLRATRWQSLEPFVRNTTIAVSGTVILAGNTFAQAPGNSPWENAVNVLQTAFTGPIAKGLALVAIVVGGLTFAFGEGGGKKTFAGIVFGLGMAVLAVNFLTWLFGV
jgi:type IV secretory pathway VirB2 component (pilin)